jgi:hypothetical protein
LEEGKYHFLIINKSIDHLEDLNVIDSKAVAADNLIEEEEA